MVERRRLRFHHVDGESTVRGPSTCVLRLHCHELHPRTGLSAAALPTLAAVPAGGGDEQLGCAGRMFNSILGLESPGDSRFPPHVVTTKSASPRYKSGVKLSRVENVLGGRTGLPANRERSGGSDLGSNLPEVTLAKKQGQEVIQGGESVKPRAGGVHPAGPAVLARPPPPPLQQLQGRARRPGEPGVTQTALLSGEMPCPLPPRAPSK